jgi:hypothetical protein
MRECAHEIVRPRCASASPQTPTTGREHHTPEACDHKVCDYSRLSGVTHLRASPSGVLQPLNLLCEAFGRRSADSPVAASPGGRDRARMTRAEAVTRGRGA